MKWTTNFNIKKQYRIFKDIYTIKKYTEKITVVCVENDKRIDQNPRLLR